MSSAARRADATAPGHERRPQVVYVMGAGRSGSTILGITLGNCEGFFFAGELARWHRRGGEPLAGAERGEFWREVRGRVDEGEHPLGREATLLQRSSFLFRVRTWPAQRRIRPRYRRVTEEIFRAIADTAAAEHIVDTSHFPRRAWELRHIDGIDLYLLFLVRDPESVVAAYQRRDVVQGPRFDVLATNGYLWLTSLLSTLVFLTAPRERRMLVSHERFLAEPESVLGDILRGTGSPAAIPDLTALKTGLAFLGNRVVSSDTVALRAEPERARRRSPMTALLQLPWRLLDGRLRPRAGEGG